MAVANITARQTLRLGLYRGHEMAPSLAGHAGYGIAALMGMSGSFAQSQKQKWLRLWSTPAVFGVSVRTMGRSSLH